MLLPNGQTLNLHPVDSKPQGCVIVKLYLFKDHKFVFQQQLNSRAFKQMQITSKANLFTNQAYSSSDSQSDQQHLPTISEQQTSLDDFSFTSISSHQCISDDCYQSFTAERNIKIKQFLGFGRQYEERSIMHEQWPKQSEGRRDIKTGRGSGKQNANHSNVEINLQNDLLKAKEYHKREAKIQIMREIKLSKMFRAWKGLSRKIPALIEKEEKKIKMNLRTVFEYFKQWKIVTIKQKRASQFYRKKICRLFFMSCSKLLQIRIKGIYLEEVLKVRRFPHIYRAMKQDMMIRRSMIEKVMKKRRLSEVVVLMKKVLMEKQSWKLSVLVYQRNLKWKCWKFWSDCHKKDSILN